MSTVCALAIAIQAGVPTLTWGPPGVGKSASITMLADALSLPLEVVLASIREPSDFSGLPVIREEGVRMEPPAWAHRLALVGKGLLFLAKERPYLASAAWALRPVPKPGLRSMAVDMYWRLYYDPE